MLLSKISRSGLPSNLDIHMNIRWIPQKLTLGAEYYACTSSSLEVEKVIVIYCHFQISYNIFIREVEIIIPEFSNPNKLSSKIRDLVGIQI